MPMAELSLNRDEDTPKYHVNDAVVIGACNSLLGLEVPNSPTSHLQRGNPTIFDWPNFSAEADAEALRKAMKGIGCDSKTVIEILCKRSNRQRQQIKHVFKTMYGKDLEKELISELHGHLEDVIVALMRPPATYDAFELRNSMRGAGTTETTLIDILCTRTNEQIQGIKQEYLRLYKTSIEDDVESDTSFCFKRLLISMLAAGRNEATTIDPVRAKADAERLYKAGEKKIGTDEEVFNAILALQSYAQLQQVFNEYQNLTRHSIERAIQQEFTGSVRDGLLAVVKCARNRAAYFAEVLYVSMKGLGTSDGRLIRTIVSRCEVDLADIKTEFARMYKDPLEKWIEGDTSGKYKAALLTLATGNVR